MDRGALAATFGARLPEWVLDEIADDEPRLASLEERMRLLNRLADRNPREGTGGPFAALVADPRTGEIVSIGVNLVLASNVSSMHAEVVAISLAQVRHASWDLASHEQAPLELMVNWRPCVMCYGAAMWSGIEQLVIAGEGDEVELLTGFDEGPMRADWRQQFEQRGITVTSDVLRDEAVEVFRRYGQRGDAVVYNGRQRPFQ